MDLVKRGAGELGRVEEREAEVGMYCKREE